MKELQIIIVLLPIIGLQPYFPMAVFPITNSPNLFLTNKFTLFNQNYLSKPQLMIYLNHCPKLQTL